MKINEKIRKLREQKELSQEEMAEKLDLSKSGYSKLERGKTHAKFINQLKQIADIFEMNLIDLFLFGEDRNILIQSENNNSPSHLSLVLSHKNDFEIEKLNLIIAQKDEIIQNKQDLIQQLQKENELLKEMIELLKNKR